MHAPARDAVASPPPPTPSDLRLIAAGDQQRCRELIDRWELSIRRISSRYAPRHSDLDDLLQVGRLGVYQAALNYKASSEVPFDHYAKRSIKNRVSKEAGRLARQRRLEASKDGEFSGGDSEFEDLRHDHGADPVREWTVDLPEPHATIFRLLYVQRLKQREVSRHLGVSQPRVSQMHRGFLELARATFAG